jgi:uncharacterized protein YqeY
MDDPRSKMNDALKEAMKTKDTVRRDVIRMALNSIKQVEIDTRKPVTPEDAMAVLQKEVKKRRETIEEAQKAGRSELAEQEQNELTILEAFMPKQLSRDEIVTLVREIIAQTGATSANDKGKVMGLLMPKVKGLADGKLVNQVVQELLSS